MIKKTGVRLTDAEFEEAKRRARDRNSAPMAKVHGRWLSDDAAEAFSGWIDAQAVLHGLPAPPILDGEVSHYGLTDEGEFSTYEPGDEPTPAPEMTGEAFASQAEALRHSVLADMAAAKEKAAEIQAHVRELEKLGFDPHLDGYGRPNLLSSVMGRDWTRDVRIAAQNSFNDLVQKFMGWK